MVDHLRRIAADLDELARRLDALIELQRGDPETAHQVDRLRLARKKAIAAANLCRKGRDHIT